jgi:A/G-specific adenine glycosylase
MLHGRSLPIFRRRLLDWFRQYRRELPWRATKDAYRVWLSEIMLQQTRVAAVIPYYQRFLQRFPSTQALATAPEEEILRMWSGLGYYGRARNLQRAAQEIVARFAGEFPRSEREARELPGIGAYTAAAILSIAYGEKLAALDGNVARVLARLFAMEGDLREGSRWRQLQDRADSLLEQKSPGDWNQAMMELGATVCTPRSPQCLLCPVTDFCEARKMGIAESLPAIHKKRAVVEVAVASAVFVDAQGRTVLLPPPASIRSARQDEDITTLVSKMWHFPTVAARAKPDKLLREHLRTLLKLPAGNPELVLEALPPARHSVTYRALTIQPYRIRCARLPRIAGAKIVALSQVDAHSSLAISNLTRKAARAALLPAKTLSGE